MSRPSQHIVVFDGVCNFCNGAVNFIIQRDPQKLFVFSPMQTEFAQDLVETYSIENTGVDIFLLLKNEECYLWSSAALEIAKDLRGYWFLFGVLRIIPTPIRDFFYRIFARNRYRLFGRSDHCMIPDAELRDRFIGID